MAQGKFSQPRPHRDEERQIEQAFRQVTAKESTHQSVTPVLRESADLEKTTYIPTAAQQEPVPQASQPAAADTPASTAPGQQPNADPAQKEAIPNPDSFDLLPDDLNRFFEEDAPYPEDMPEESDPDFLDKAAAFFRKAAAYCKEHQKVVMAGTCAAALLLIIGFICLFFAGSSDSDDGLILDNVYLADIEVGGMTKNEAINAVKAATGNTFGSQDMVIDLSGTELRLSPKDTGVSLDVKAAVNAAYDYGRTGTKAEQEQAYENAKTEDHIIALLPYLDLDTDYIREVLTTYAQDSGSTLTQTTYGLEGEDPELSADKFNANAPTQTLVITLGTPGVGFDANDVYNQVLDAYSLHSFLVEVENVEAVKEPDPVDLEAIYDEYYIAPVNATVNMQTFKTEAGSYGYGFDVEAAQKLVDAAEYGDEVRIPMEYIAPDILDADSFFKDTLGEYKTRTTGNDSRNTNLSLACKAINNTVLNPGESLSFSTALKNVSGFKNAPEDTGREEVAQGGVSQVASTLYYAALLSDLEINSRSNHGYVPSFIEYGLDATSSLKISNSTGFPIRIEAEISGAYVVVRIIGTEERDYYVSLDYAISTSYKPVTEYQDFEYDNEEGYQDGDVIEEGSTGYLVKSYKVKYDTKTGAELSRDFIANSQYPAANKIVARVAPEPTTEPTTEPTEEATEAPTQAKPTETTAPPATEAPAPSTEPTAAPSTEPSSEPTDAPAAEPTVPATEAQEQALNSAEEDGSTEQTAAATQPSTEE